MVVRRKSCRYGVEAEKATGPGGIVQLVLSGMATDEEGALSLSQNFPADSSMANVKTEDVSKRVAKVGASAVSHYAE